MSEETDTPSEAPAKARLPVSTVAVVVMLIVVFPAGLYLVWRRTAWTFPVKWLVTAGTLLGSIVVLDAILGAAFGFGPERSLRTLAAQNLWVGVALVLVATGTAISLLLLMRSHAPTGGFVTDNDRSAAIFSTTGTMFSVLLALVILLSVETYRSTQSHTNAEADSVLQQFQLATLFPSRTQYSVQSELICYGRSVSELEWPLMRDGEFSETVDYWGQAIDHNIRTVNIAGSKSEAGFHFFLAQNLQRQEERRGRLEGADGTLPPIVWPILLIGAAATVAFLLAYADRKEEANTQIFQVGLVTFVLGSCLLLISALDHPFGENPGNIKPTKMLDALAVMEGSLATSIDAPNLNATLPCDAEGVRSDTEHHHMVFPRNSTMEQISARGKLVVGVTFGLPLFGAIDPISGDVSGFDIDLAREIAKELGLREDQIEFVDTPLPDRIPYLENGIVDMVVLAMTITPERGEQVAFSRPYYLAGQSIMVTQNNRSIAGINDLAGQRVCVVPESTSAATIAERVPGAELVHLPTFNACVVALRQGEVDAVCTDDIVLAGFSADDEDLLLVGGQFTTEPYGVAVPRGNEDLAEFVDSVIGRMLFDGRWGRLYYSYLGSVPGLPSVHAAKNELIGFDIDAPRE